MFKYLLKFNSEEHLLYLKEIAELYGLNTINGHPNSRLVTVILNEYESIQKQTYPEILWEGNMRRVWPYEQYHPAMTWFLEMVDRTGISQYTSKGITHNFMVNRKDVISE